MELRSAFLVLFYMFKFCAIFTAANDYFNIEYKWSQIEFDFPCENEREESIKNGTFKEGKVVPTDVQVYYPDCANGEKTVFITCPRISDGVPATFGTVTKKRREGNPIIAPYPNWNWHTEPEKCKHPRIVSVFRVFIDKCNRLWILDSGNIADHQICPPQILLFDLETDVLLHRYEVPFEQHLNTSLYITPMVEIDSENCENAFVYIADSSGFSMLVYDFKNDDSWRIDDKTFEPDPDFLTYTIDGVSFNVTDGIFGLALSPPGDGRRKLFYQAMSSGTENWVYTDHLKNKSLFSGTTRAPEIFHTYPEERDTQSAAEAMDAAGNLYFGLLSDTQIASWNIKEPYGYCNFYIVGDNKETMQFPSGMKVTRDENGEEVLWIIAIAYQRLATNTIFSNQTNFVVSSAKINDFQT